MCLSPTVDLVASVAIGVVAADTVRHIAHPREVLLGILPALFALHQFVEAFVWWSLDGVVGADTGKAATWVYLTFALVVLPTLIPAAIALIEPDDRRRRWMWRACGLGVVTSMVLGLHLFDGTVEAQSHGPVIEYGFGLRWPIVVVAGYLVATCAPLLLASWPSLRWYGMANVIAVGVVGAFAIGGIVSLWCFWAAISSVAIAVHMRRRRSLDVVRQPVLVAPR